MVDLSCYLSSTGEVNRARISQDIKNGKLSYDEVTEIIKNPTISASFFGNEYHLKRDNHTDWDDRYLDHLTLASVSEVFNADYLLHLAEVAKYVDNSKAKGKKVSVGGIVAAAIVIIGIIVIVAMLTKK